MSEDIKLEGNSMKTKMTKSVFVLIALPLALIAMLGFAACDHGNGGGDTVADIPQGAYEGRTDLTEFTIPDGVVHIGNRAFSGCTNLTSITIPASVRWIGSYAFYNCTSLKEVHYNGDLASWCSISFSGDEAQISISNPLQYANKLYINGELLTNADIPSGVTRICDYAFYGCTGLTSVTIPDSVTSIGDSAFTDCKSLADVTIPDSVTSIGSQTFFYCTSLTTVTIPASVTSIGNWAFGNCTSLASVTFSNTNGWSYYTDFNHTSTVAINASDMANASTTAQKLKTTADNVTGNEWRWGLIRNP